LVFTYNPIRLSGRHMIDSRILENMIIAQMDQPRKEERAKIIEGFYGVWMPEEEKKEIQQKRPDLSQPKKKVAEAAVGEIERSHTVKREMTKGLHYFDENEKVEDRKPSDITKKPEAYGIFEPELYPFTRIRFMTHIMSVRNRGKCRPALRKWLKYMT